MRALEGIQMLTKWLMPRSGQARSHQSTHAACSQSRVTGHHVSGVTIPVMGIPVA